MDVTKEVWEKEEKHLEKVNALVGEKISSLGQELYDREEKIIEFKELMWDSRGSMDANEMKSMITSSDLEVALAEGRGSYFRKLFRVQSSPYFGSFVFDDGVEEEIHVGITHVDEDNYHYVYDWRAPICSLFYDAEVGKTSYKAPRGIVEGELTDKKQIKIENGKLLRILNSKLQIDDDVLQEVLATEANDKMKNIVNTIQQEQNQVIRNVEDRTLVVQGIAGSGKTSVALHRIAFLLYKIENLSANNVLIFSPNKVFSEYISNVLPELGEDNTLQTTFDGFMYDNILEFKAVQTFTNFIEQYYHDKNLNIKLIKYKQSDKIIDDLNLFVKDYISNLHFSEDYNHPDFYYSKEALDEMFHNRYSSLLLFDRVREMALKICNDQNGGKKTFAKVYEKVLKESLGLKKDYKELFIQFFTSKIFINSYGGELDYFEVKKSMSGKEITYQDACVFIYLKGLLEGFMYKGLIKEVIIDEAQDYTRLQYIIIKEIFKKAGLTILGDVNQTINPYYRYDSLNQIMDIVDEDGKYLELMKTYRSSEEIIEYTNKILGLSHIQAIRKSNNVPVVKKIETNLKSDLLSDIMSLKEHSKSLAIITKTKEEAEIIYELLKEDYPNIGLILKGSEKFNRELIIVPSYIAKGLEFDSVIIYTKKDNCYTEEEKYLFYVACTRCQHQLIVYNQNQ